MKLVVKTEVLDRIPNWAVQNETEKEALSKFRFCSKVLQENHPKYSERLCECLCLEPLDEEQPIEEIFEEGMYRYYSTWEDFKIIEDILEFMWTGARPLMILSMEDIFTTITD